MESIAISNFRSFKELGPIELRPITITVGNNSSGKSTFLRTFPLFRQSCEVQKTSPALLYGPLVDFGGLNEARNRTSQGEDIKFCFTFTLPAHAKKRGPNSFRSLLDFIHRQVFPAGAKLTISIGINGDPGTGKTHPTEYKFAINNDIISLSFTDSGALREITINELRVPGAELNVSIDSITNFLPTSISPTKPTEGASIAENALYDTITAYATRQLKVFFGETKKNPDPIDDLIMLPVCAPEELLPLINRSPSKSVTFEEIRSHWTSTSDSFLRFRNLLLLASLRRILAFCDQFLAIQFSRVRYIAPIRATSERYYRSQDLSVSEMDPQGKNLAVLLQSLKQAEVSEFCRWSTETLGFQVKAEASNGHITLMYKDARDGSLYNVADMGFGVSQILPIAAQLWMLLVRRRRTPEAGQLENSIPFLIVIEQPELHLHPALQSKLADIFVKLANDSGENGHNVKFIIETHSDTIIKRIGMHISDKDLPTESTNIIIMEKDPTTKNTVAKVSTFLPSGELQNWPFGFFEPEII